MRAFTFSLSTCYDNNSEAWLVNTKKRSHTDRIVSESRQFALLGPLCISNPSMVDALIDVCKKDTIDSVCYILDVNIVPGKVIDILILINLCVIEMRERRKWKQKSASLTVRVPWRSLSWLNSRLFWSVCEIWQMLKLCKWMFWWWVYFVSRKCARGKWIEFVMGSKFFRERVLIIPLFISYI